MPREECKVRCQNHKVTIGFSTSIPSNRSQQNVIYIMFARTLLYKGLSSTPIVMLFGKVQLDFLLFNITNIRQEMHKHQTRDEQNTYTSFSSLACVSLMEHNVSIPMNTLHPRKIIVTDSDTDFCANSPSNLSREPIVIAKPAH